MGRTRAFLIGHLSCCLLIASSAQGQTPVVIDASPTSFLCHLVRRIPGSTSFDRRDEFWLRDGLRRTFVDVTKPELVCNSTDSAGRFSDEHLTGYRLRRSRGSKRFALDARIPLDNALGRTYAVLRDRDRVLVPAALHSGTSIPPGAEAPDAEAYSCYELDRRRAATGFARGTQVSLVDAFLPAATYDVLHPTRLCLAAAAETPPARDPSKRLLCYAVRRTGSNAAAATRAVSTTDRFGDLHLATTGRSNVALELCLTSTVPDFDGDGLDEQREAASGTRADLADSDADGLADGYEVDNDLDPLSASDSGTDPDGDGLTNLQESALGTDPNVADTDGDGLADGAEVTVYRTSPTLADSDADTIDDARELSAGLNPNSPDDANLDPDADGLSNRQELAAGTDRTRTDTDGDGSNDGLELFTLATDPLDPDMDDDGLSDTQEATIFGTNPRAFDTDGGGRDDYAEVTIDASDPLDGSDDVLAFPALSTSQPLDRARFIPRSSWIRLRFAHPFDPRLVEQLSLTCGGTQVTFAATIVEARNVILNPDTLLPASQSCVLSWPGYSGASSLSFTTAAPGSTSHVIYNRDDTRARHPFPDDFWLVPDATTATGSRVAVPIPTGTDLLPSLYTSLLERTNQHDGFSPAGPIVVALAAPPNSGSLPTTTEQSLDPMASVGLFDLDPSSPTYAQRVPFELKSRFDITGSGLVSYTLLIFPSVPLEPGRSYGLVLTNRVTLGSRPFEASPFFQAALAPPTAGESANVTRVRSLATSVLDVVGSDAVPAIPVEDVILATRISIRSVDAIASDLLSIRDQLALDDPGRFEIDSVKAPNDPTIVDLFYPEDVAAVVYGRWMSPNWREGSFVARDDDGSPRVTGTRPLRFVLLLPKSSGRKPAPLLMYQNGNPGSAEAEVPFFGSWKNGTGPSLAQSGFALIGFTDTMNREVSAGYSDPNAAINAQINRIFLELLGRRDVPDYWLQTNADQLSFLRMLPTLRRLDVLPLGSPDGVPDLDLTLPLGYFGLSYGAIQGSALLPYAPEIRAAALTVGGGPLAQMLIHQNPEAFILGIGSFFPAATPAEIWTAMALFQAVFDRQDGYNHMRFLYREPFAVGGSLDKASVLLTVGLNDMLAPNNGTEAMAHGMGPIPLLLPEYRRVPQLDKVSAPVSANIDAKTTAAMSQYVPAGMYEFAATLGCEFEYNGHYCAQTAPPALMQRARYFQSALSDGAPVIESFVPEP